MHAPAYRWFVQNNRRLKRCFDVWYCIPNETEAQRRGVLSSDSYFINYYENFCRYHRFIRFRNQCAYCEFNRIEFIDAKYLAPPNGEYDKAELCDMAYQQAKKDRIDYLWQIDADEWYNVDDVRDIKRVVEEDDVMICNIREHKIWKNYKHLKSKFWKSNPARIFRVLPDFKIGGHRPPFLVGDEKYECDPRRLHPIWSKLNSQVMDHFCYFDDLQVKLKSLMFKELRPNDPIYSQYYEWYKEWYVPWNGYCYYESWKYHPAQKIIVINDKCLRDYIKEKYPESFDFLESFV